MHRLDAERDDVFPAISKLIDPPYLSSLQKYIYCMSKLLHASACCFSHPVWWCHKYTAIARGFHSLQTWSRAWLCMSIVQLQWVNRPLSDETCTCTARSPINAYWSACNGLDLSDYTVLYAIICNMKNIALEKGGSTLKCNTGSPPSLQTCIYRYEIFHPSGGAAGPSPKRGYYSSPR